MSNRNSSKTKDTPGGPTPGTGKLRDYTGYNKTWGSTKAGNKYFRKSSVKWWSHALELIIQLDKLKPIPLEIV